MTATTALPAAAIDATPKPGDASGIPIEEPPPTQAPPLAPPQAGSATVRVIAEGDIQVTIAADDVEVYTGWLESGRATEWYSAKSFVVFTSDGSLTIFENAATGEQFYMGFGQNETYYLSG